MIRKILALLLLLLVADCAAMAQRLDKPKLDSLFATLESHNKAMGSLAISSNGVVVYQKQVGYLSVNGNDKLSPDVHTKYRIGSVSKMFTATMIFQLIEEGKLSLNTPLSTWYSELPNAAKITISNLLDHRSGLHNFTNDSTYGQYMNLPRTEEQMVAVFAKMKPDFEPDAKAQYSNTNFVLLGYIIEKITKKPYSEELKKRIASKLGLNDTYYGGKTNVKNNEAYSYSFDSSWTQAPETDMSVPGGAGAILSTPTDLVKFIGALFAGKLISAEHLSLMKTQKEHYGMAMFELNFGDKKGYGHNGGIDGFTSVLTYFPDDKLAIAYCSNGGAYGTDKIKNDALNIYFNMPFIISDFKTIALKTQELDKYLGVYSSTQLPLKVTISKENTTLKAQATGQGQFSMDAMGQDKFKFDPAGIVVEFEPSKNQFTLKQGGGTYLFTKDK
jgi:CubicO group peptidase (beta-lactamase class C family)